MNQSEIHNASFLFSVTIYFTKKYNNEISGGGGLLRLSVGNQPLPSASLIGYAVYFSKFVYGSAFPVTEFCLIMR